MSILITLLYIVFVLSAIVLIVVILLQEGRGGGFGQALGEHGQQTFGVGAKGINTFTGWTAGEIGQGVDYRTGFLFFESLVRGEWAAVGRALQHLVLPALALATIPLAVITRMTRSAMLDVLGQDYIRTARAKGLSQSRVVLVHGLRNALIPILTVIGNNFAALLTGAVLTETVFAWPGVGRPKVEAEGAADCGAAADGVADMRRHLVECENLRY